MCDTVAPQNDRLWMMAINTLWYATLKTRFGFDTVRLELTPRYWCPVFSNWWTISVQPKRTGMSATNVQRNFPSVFVEGPAGKGEAAHNSSIWCHAGRYPLSSSLKSSPLILVDKYYQVSPPSSRRSELKNVLPAWLHVWWLMRSKATQLNIY